MKHTRAPDKVSKALATSGSPPGIFPCRRATQTLPDCSISMYSSKLIRIRQRVGRWGNTPTHNKCYRKGCNTYYSLPAPCWLLTSLVARSTQTLQYRISLHTPNKQGPLFPFSDLHQAAGNLGVECATVASLFRAETGEAG